MSEQLVTKAIELIDKANNEDPNQENVDGESWPKELLYSHRMSDMLERYKTDADRHYSDFYSGYNSEAMVRARILSLIDQRCHAIHPALVRLDDAQLFTRAAAT